jgi:hypothetical protein
MRASMSALLPSRSRWPAFSFSRTTGVNLDCHMSEWRATRLLTRRRRHDNLKRTATAPMLKRVVGYSYTWDFVDDPAAAPRAAGLGLDAVVLAASYHATRAGTPLHPDRRIFEAETAACYVPIRESAWRGRRLIPVAPTWDPRGESFGNAHRQLTAEGLSVEAWTVLTHNAALGREHGDLVVRNAFGDRYPYALCPAFEEVQEYCLTLVQEILASGPVDDLVLESCGPMGFDHVGKHEKTEFAGWDEVRRTLLSLCFCRACESRYAAAGVDSDELARKVRAGVDSASGATVEDGLGSDLAAQLAGVRTDIAAQLRKLLVVGARSIRPDARVAVHGSSDRWATGSFATLQPDVGDGIAAVVASCWDADGGSRRIEELRVLAPSGIEIGAYLRLDRDWDPGDATDRRLQEYLASGMTELHLYHLGLLGRHGLEVLRNVIARATQLADEIPT